MALLIVKWTDCRAQFNATIPDWLSREFGNALPQFGPAMAAMKTDNFVDGRYCILRMLFKPIANLSSVTVDGLLTELLNHMFRSIKLGLWNYNPSFRWT